MSDTCLQIDMLHENSEHYEYASLAHISAPRGYSDAYPMVLDDNPVLHRSL